MGDLKENTLKQKEVIEKLCQEGYLKGIIRSYRGGLSSVLCTMVGCSTFFIIYEFMKIELKLQKQQDEYLKNNFTVLKILYHLCLFKN